MKNAVVDVLGVCLSNIKSGIGFASIMAGIDFLYGGGEEERFTICRRRNERSGATFRGLVRVGGVVSYEASVQGTVSVTTPVSCNGKQGRVARSGVRMAW